MLLCIAVAAAAPLDPAAYTPLDVLQAPAMPSTIDTDALTWDTPGGASYVGVLSGATAVFAFDTVTLTHQVTVQGSRPVAILALGDLDVDGPIVAAAQDTTAGAGGYDGAWFGPYGWGPGSGPGGGGIVGVAASGGGFGGAGGGSSPGAIYGDLSVLLEGGSGGGQYEIYYLYAYTSYGGGFGGGGGGAVELGAGGSLDLGPLAVVDVRGAAGGDPAGGGGAGGGVVLHGRGGSCTGLITASGGDGTPAAFGYFGDGGSGGGGRVWIDGLRWLDGCIVDVAPGASVLSGGAGVFERVDVDGDGLSEAEEAVLGTDPDHPDSDRDGLLDGDEVPRATDPMAADSDGGGALDGAEVLDGTDPTLPGDDLVDGDGDGLSDAVEGVVGTGISSADTDGDGLSDGQEWLVWSTDPLVPDTDGDGLSDGLELGLAGDADPTTHTDPNRADTDGDGLVDGAEDTNGDGAFVAVLGDSSGPGSGETDPLEPDTDGDGLTDGDEVNVHGTSPVDSDSDDDGADDGTEIDQGTDPLELGLDPSAFVPLTPSLTVTVASSIDTDTRVWDISGSPPLVGVVSGGVAVFAVGDGLLQGDITVTGSLPVAILSQADLVVEGTIDVSARLEQPGPGGHRGGTNGLNADGQGPGGGTSGPAYSSTGGGFGGAGGPQSGGGGQPYGNLLQQLEGGSGGASIYASTGAGGGGGGAIWLGAGGELTLGPVAVVDASGGHGQSDPNPDFGASGGSGGGIVLSAASGQCEGSLLVPGGDASDLGVAFLYNAGGGGGRIVTEGIDVSACAVDLDPGLGSDPARDGFPGVLEVLDPPLGDTGDTSDTGTGQTTPPGTTPPGTTPPDTAPPDTGGPGQVVDKEGCGCSSSPPATGWLRALARRRSLR